MPPRLNCPFVGDGFAGGDGFSGGSGGAGGYRFQALASAYVSVHALAAHPLNWVGVGDAVPVAFSAETGGPGDDLRVEFGGGTALELQAKRGLRSGTRLWETLRSLARGLHENPSLRCVLLVDADASRPVRGHLKRDLERLAQGRTDRSRPITAQFLDLLKGEGIAAEPSLLGRLSVVVADMGDASADEGAALALLARATEGPRFLDAWVALKDDGLRLAEMGGRRDLAALRGLLERHGIRTTGPTTPAAAQREDDVPPFPRPFVGRDGVVREVGESLTRAGEQRPAVAVRGLPGSGKTAVAAAVANGLKPSFPGGVLWASVGPTPSPLAVLAGWGRALGADDLAGYRNVGAASARVRALLRGKRALLVLDDVWEPEHAAPFAVGGPESATLATTRSRGVAAELAPGGVRDLGVLEEADSVSLLGELAPSLSGNDRARLPELAGKLGHLPLALRVAGRLLEGEAALGLGVGGLLDELAEGEGLLEAAVPPDLSDLVEATTPTVAALLGRSAERLGDDDRGRFARLAAFAPGPASFDFDAADAAWAGAGGGSARGTLAALVRRGLVEPGGSGRFAVHPVLSMQARSLLRRAPGVGRAASFLHASHYLGALRSADALYHGGGEARQLGSSIFDADWENIRAGQAWAAGAVAADPRNAEAARLVGAYADAGWRWLLPRVGLGEQARWLEDALVADRVLAEASASAGAAGGDAEEAARARRSAEARHRHLLADVRRQSGRTDEAFALERETREMYRSLGDRRGESRALNGLGALHTARSEHDLAEGCFLEALRLLDAEADGPGEDPSSGRGRDRDRAAVLGNMGPLYRHLERPRRAEGAIREAIAIFRAIGDVRQVGIAYDNLGVLRSEAGDRRGARPAFNAARRIFRSLGTRMDEALAVLNLARVRADEGEYAPAEREALEVIGACEEFGADSIKGWALDTLGDARLGLGDRRAAEEAYWEQRGIARRTQDNRLEVMALRSLGRAALADLPPGPDPEAALSFSEQALEAAHPESPPDLRGSVLFDAALALDALGRRAEAVGKAQESLETLGERSPAKVAEVKARLAEWRNRDERRSESPA